jgi:hypothetical protein
VAVLVPPQFAFHYKAEDERNSVKLLFKRRTDVMPPAPKVGGAVGAAAAAAATALTAYSHCTWLLNTPAQCVYRAT